MPLVSEHPSARSPGDRASASGAEDRWFESSRAYQVNKGVSNHIANPFIVFKFGFDQSCLPLNHAQQPQPIPKKNQRQTEQSQTEKPHGIDVYFADQEVF